jgi:hypothetical protein
MKPFQFVFNTVGQLLVDLAKSASLGQSTRQHRYCSTGMGEDELNTPTPRERT